MVASVPLWPSVCCQPVFPRVNQGGSGSRVLGDQVEIRWRSGVRGVLTSQVSLVLHITSADLQ